MNRKSASLPRAISAAESIIPQSDAQNITVRPIQSVEKLTGAHTEGEIKVLVELFQKLVGTKGRALGAAP